MDPSRIKLFELDEMDEIMNGCVGAGAFAEALHKDIEGIDSTNLAASITNRNAGVLTQDDSSTTLKNNLQFTKHLTQLEQVKISSSRYQNQHIDSQLQCDHRLLQHGNTHCESQKGHSDNFSWQNVDNNPSQDIHQHSKVQKQKVQQFNNQQPPNTDLSNNSLNWKIPKNSLELNMLVPQLQPLLDKDRSMLLRDLYIKLLNNEISKENYLKVCNKVVADRMIRREAAVHQAQMQNPVQSQSQSLYHGTSIKFPPKKPPIGKKKTLETSGNSQPQASKKQKTSGAFLDQSIEQLNYVTAVSGVNLRAEGEQLLVARTEGTQASEAIQRVVQEEEETSILQKGPLQKKLTQIISRCGLGGISKDVEYCLSMCVEERLRSFIGKLIRLSKQRLDIENKRHKLVVTFDIQHQILTMNQKAKKEWEKKQAEESEKFCKLDNALADAEQDVEKDKDNRPSKKHKVHREEDDKMRTTAANAAARAAIGVDDMLSKWQLMAEQARQNRESKLGVSSSHQQGTSIDENHSLNFRENMGNLEEDGGMSRHGRSIGNLSNPKIDRTICIKDAIAALEREPMMSRSTLLYRLYERRSSGFGAG